MVDQSLLRESADRGVRLVALSLLSHAQKAGDKLESLSQELQHGDAGSDTALHDFRVAVRRLRSWIRAFHPQLSDAVSRKQQRRLSKIADATGATRDATVHLEWLRDERRALSARQRVGHSLIRKRMQKKRRDGSDSALSAATEFHAMIAKLRRRLKVYRCDVLAPDPPARFGAIVALRLLTESESLRRDLAAIRQATDIDASHRARIAAKRLRYVAEPVSKLANNGAAIIDTLKTLQDALGDLHDVHVLSPEIEAAVEDADARPGLLRLSRRLQERGARAYADIEQHWLQDAGASFFDRVRELAADITRCASIGVETGVTTDEALFAPSVDIK